MKPQYNRIKYIFSGINAEKKLPAITFLADQLNKNNTTTQIDEKQLTNEQLTEENEQYVFKDDDLSERGIFLHKKISLISLYISVV